MLTITMLCSRGVLILMLIPAVNSKVWRVSAVSSVVERWKIVPRHLALPAAWILVLSELGVLVAMSSGVALRIGAVAAVVLFGTMAAAAGSVVARGLSTSCSCFSLDGTEKVSRITVMRAAVLSLLSLAVVWGSGWSIRPEPAWSPVFIVLTLPLWAALLQRVRFNRGLRVERARV